MKRFIISIICLNNLISNGSIAIDFANTSGYDGNLDSTAQYVVQLVHNNSGIPTDIDWSTLRAPGDTIIYTYITLIGAYGTFASQGSIEFEAPPSGVVFIRILRLNSSAGDFGSAWIVASYPYTEYDPLNPSTIYTTDGIVNSPFYLGTSGTSIGNLGGQHPDPNDPLPPIGGGTGSCSTDVVLINPLESGSISIYYDGGVSDDGMMSIGFGTYEISAQASSGYEFSHWSNNSGNIGSSNPVSFQDFGDSSCPTYITTLTAHFIPLDTDGDGLSDIDEVNIQI